MERVVFDKVRKSRRRRWRRRKKFRNCIQKKTHKDVDLVDQTTSATPAKKKKTGDEKFLLRKKLGMATQKAKGSGATKIIQAYLPLP
jgi:hypothetical protein